MSLSLSLSLIMTTLSSFLSLLSLPDLVFVLYSVANAAGFEIQINIIPPRHTLSISLIEEFNLNL